MMVPITQTPCPAMSVIITAGGTTVFRGLLGGEKRKGKRRFIVIFLGKRQEGFLSLWSLLAKEQSA